MAVNLPANWPVYIVTTLGGFALFGWSVYRLLRTKPISEIPEIMPEAVDRVI
jgi:H+/Cl- antiporter ClcA